jgi:hypothetical protein
MLSLGCARRPRLGKSGPRESHAGAARCRRPSGPARPAASYSARPAARVGTQRICRVPPSAAQGLQEGGTQALGRAPRPPRPRSRWRQAGVGQPRALFGVCTALAPAGSALPSHAVGRAALWAGGPQGELAPPGACRVPLAFPAEQAHRAPCGTLFPRAHQRQASRVGALSAITLPAGRAPTSLPRPRLLSPRKPHARRLPTRPFPPQVLLPEHEAQHAGKTLGQYLASHGYCSTIVDHYLLPMCASVWSVPAGQVRWVLGGRVVGILQGAVG